MKRISSAALVAVVMLSAAACSMGPRKSEADRAADKETANKVQLALNADTLLYARHITVRADGGAVTLGGYVWSQPDLEEAQRITAGVPGVSRVVNEMELERGGVDNSPVSR